jgi:MFS family permease
VNGGAGAAPAARRKLAAMIRKPRAILALLTGLNFLNYLDRYLVAAVLLAVRDDLGMTSLAAGALGTVFLLGYFVVAPFFGSLGDRVPRKYIIAFGVALWSLATVGSGLAGHTGSMVLLFVSRALVGVGEAAYATLAPTIIDDITPPEKKGPRGSRSSTWPRRSARRSASCSAA